jgi:hypothetical protein
VNREEATFLAKMRDAFATAAEACNDYLNVKQSTEQITTAPKPVQKQEESITSEQSLLNNFPEELAAKLTVSEVYGEWWITKQYDRTEQGKVDFAKITRVVKALGGSWDPAGKNSHWSVPK